MADFDFENAQLPALLPLQASHEATDEEAQYKALFLDIWRNHAAKQAFDLNVSGMAHLGSFEQVRRTITEDGLALLPGSDNEARTRYLYRAWNARNHRGRGLHFLDVYLQMLAPGVAKAEQLWLPIGGTYPQDCVTIIPESQYFMPLIEEDTVLSLDGSWQVGGMVDLGSQIEKGYWAYNTENLILTSRVRLTLDFSVDVSGVGNLMQIVRSVLPARFVPEFHYVIVVEAPTPVLAYSHVDVMVTKPIAMASPDLLMVTDDPEVMWELGDDDDPESAPKLVGTKAEVFF